MPRKRQNKPLSPLGQAYKEWWSTLSEEEKKDPAVIRERQRDHCGKASIAHERQLFEETENPLHIWSVYMTCREFKQPFPSEVAEAFEWVLVYMDEVAKRLLCDLGREMIVEGNNYKPEWLEYALGMRPTAEGPKTQSGGKQHFAQKRDLIMKNRYLDLVMNLLYENENLSIPKACERSVEIMAIVGSETVQCEAVEKWYKEYQFQHTTT